MKQLRRAFAFLCLTWALCTVFVAHAQYTPCGSFPGPVLHPNLMIFQFPAYPNASGYLMELEERDADGFLVESIPIGTLSEPSFSLLLNENSYYTWRYRPLGGGWGGAWAADCAFQTSDYDSAPLSAPFPLAPYDQALTTPTATNLEWSLVPGAEDYDLQVSLSPTFSSFLVNEAAVGANTYPLSSLAAGTTYYWRVHGWNVNGPGPETTASFTTVLPEAPADAPGLLQPGAVSGVGFVSFSWTSVSNAQQYQLLLSPIQDLSAAFDTLISSTTVQLELYPETYFWSVQALNEFGAGPWSDTVATNARIEIPSFNEFPGSGSATCGPVTVWPSWTPNVLMSAYEIQVSTDSSFTAMIETDTVPRNTSPPQPWQNYTLPPGYNYFVRMRFLSNYGPGPWCQWQHVAIVDPSGDIPPVSLEEPGNLSAGIGTLVTLEWSGVPNASEYLVEYWDVNDPQNVFTTYAPHWPWPSVEVVLPPDVTFAWRVRGLRSVCNSGEGGWSETWTFTTSEPQLDCLGVPNGEADTDACGVCYAGGASNPLWNTTCADCLGVPNGNAQVDACGICYANGPGNPLWNTTCADCLGVPNGPAQPGTPCDDEDTCTTDDAYDAGCQCAGTTVQLAEIFGPSMALILGVDTFSIAGTAGSNYTWTVDGIAQPSTSDTLIVMLSGPVLTTVNVCVRVSGCEETEVCKGVYLNGTVGALSDRRPHSELTVQPNPSRGSFLVTPSSQQMVTVSIHDVIGKRVLGPLLINGPQVLDATHLAPGAYTLVANENGGTQRIIIQH